MATSEGKLVNIIYDRPSDFNSLSFSITATASSNPTESINVYYTLGTSIISITGQLAINTNCSAGFAIFNTSNYFAEQLTNALSANGITVSNTKFGSCSNSYALTPNVTIVSPPLYNLMNHTLQWSDNLYAEVWMKTIGTLFSNMSGIDYDATESGIAVVAKQLGTLGIDNSTFVQQDGSGLSRHNLISPQALINILQVMRTVKNANIYHSFLAVAGESGTLQYRFVNTTAQGIVQAKDGTEDGVSALSGYMSHPQFPLVIFSIIINLSQLDTSTRVNYIDDIVLLLPSLREC